MEVKVIPGEKEGSLYYSTKCEDKLYLKHEVKNEISYVKCFDLIKR
jgi:hypothetical protein